VSVLLTAAIALTQFILGAMGVYVSLRPPERKYHKRWIGAFAVVGLLGVAVTIWLAKNSDYDQKALKGQLDKSLQAQSYMQGKLDTIGTMLISLSVNKSDPQLKQLLIAIINMTKANQNQGDQLVTQAPSVQSAFSGLNTETLRAVVKDFSQNIFNMVGNWNSQINQAKDVASKMGNYAPAYYKVVVNLEAGFVKEMEPRIPEANELRIVMLSRIKERTQEDAEQATWFDGALQGGGIDTDKVATAAGYLLKLSGRMIQ
jgi:hypothetical protein